MVKRRVGKNWANGCSTRDRRILRYLDPYLLYLTNRQIHFIMLRSIIIGCIVTFSTSSFAQMIVKEPKLKYYGHTDLIECVAFSPDGKTVYSGSWDKNINIYSADSSFLLKTLTAHNSAVMNLAFSKSRTKPMVLASGSKDFSIKLWDSTGAFTRDLVGYNTAVTSIAFDFAGKYFYSGSAQQGLLVWDAVTGLNTKSFSIQGINALACPKGTGMVLVGTNSPGITVVKVATGPLAETLKGHTDAVNALEVSTTGKYFVSGSSDKTAIVWDAVVNKPLTTLKGHTWKVTSVSISKDEKYVVTGSNDGTAKLWELTTGKLIASFEGYGYNVRSVAISPDNTKIVVASYERGVTEHGVRIYATGLTTGTPKAPKADADSPVKSDSSKTTKPLPKK